MTSVNRLMVSVVGAALLPLLAAAVALAVVLVKEYRKNTEHGLEESARLMTHALDAELQRSISALQALAHSGSLRRDDLKAWYTEAQEARAAIGLWDNLLLLSPSAEHLVNLRRPYGEKLPPVPQPEGSLQAARSQKAYISDALRGRVETDWLMYIAFPVVFEGTTRYVIGATMSARYWSRWLAERAPAHTIATLADRRFVILGRSHEGDRLAGQPVPGWFPQAAQGRSGGTLRGPSMTNQDVLVSFQRSPLSGWSVNLLTSGTVADAPARRAALLLTASLGAALLIAVALALLRARILTRGLHSLRNAMDGLRRRDGEAPLPMASPVKEVQDAMTVARDTALAIQEGDRRRDEFLATLAHELRNPLAPIRNSLYFLGQRQAGDPEARAAHTMMERQVGHMVRLIDDLLDVSRITRGRLELRRELVPLSRIIEHALETVRDHVPQRLTIALPAEQVMLDGDPVRLSQVIANLLHNAGKYTDAGGEVRLAAQLEGNEVVIRVSDNGIGIAADQLPRLFQIFSQLKGTLARSQGGLGIGLALARSLVELHGGRIEVRSDGPGKGSEFTVRLPVVPRPQPEGRPAAPLRRYKGAARRVLVVDDMADNADSLAALLRTDGNTVAIARDGLQALKTAEAFKPDVVLLDLGMPGLDGYETCALLRRQPWGKGIVIVAVTGWGHAGAAERAREAGFDAHLVKPVDYEALRELLGAPLMA